MAKENIINKLQRILDAHTKAYKSDFDYDRQDLLAAKAGDTFIWLCRECGTWLYPVDKALVKDSSQYNGIGYYAEADADGVVPYFVRIDSVTDEGPVGMITKTNLNKVWSAVRELAHAADGDEDQNCIRWNRNTFCERVCK